MLESYLQRLAKHLDAARRRVARWSARHRVRESLGDHRKIREETKGKPKLTWWLIYGPPRSGTTYMLRLTKTCCALYAGDWGLGPILRPMPDWLETRSSPDFGYIRFDYDRLLRDISDNIIDNAYRGTGDQLDLLYKQATLQIDQFRALVAMWGAPERTIFCFREPAGYMASAVRKFIYDSSERLQQLYVDSVESYLDIGGDTFEYTPKLTVSDYVSFLEPLRLEDDELQPFRYKGRREPDLVTEEMRAAYRKVRTQAASS